MVFELFLFSVLVAFLDFVVELGLDLGDAPVLNFRLEQEGPKLRDLVVPLLNLVRVKLAPQRVHLFLLHIALAP